MRWKKLSRRGQNHQRRDLLQPMHLPWVGHFGSPGHEHNNMPGIATDLPTA